MEEPTYVEYKAPDFYGMYNENDLSIEILEESYRDFKIEVPHIVGLKDKRVEDKINEDMRMRLQDLIDDKTVDGIFVTPRANFANIISIAVTLYADEYETMEELTLNYELINGTRLNFEDIFITQDNVKSIVSKGFYELLSKSMYHEGLLSDDEKNQIAYPDENELYKLVQGFMAQQDKSFIITPERLEINYGKYTAPISLLSIKDDVAIYNRFQTDESLYARDDIGFKNIFNFVDARLYHEFEILKFGYLENNFWYEIAMRPSYAQGITDPLPQEVEERYKSFVKEYQKKYEEEIEAYRKVAKDNPDKFYIYLAKPFVSVFSIDEYTGSEWKYYYTNLVTANEDTIFLEMSYSAYEDTYRDEIVEAYRNQYYYLNDGAMIDSTLVQENGIPYQDERVTEKTNYGTKLYNDVTGKEVTKLEDIFYENSNYINAINELVEEKLKIRGYLEKEIIDFFSDVAYDLEGTNIRVTSSYHGNVTIMVNLSEMRNFTDMKILEK